MKNRYDNNPGKDAKMAKTRQSRLEAEHSSNNEFAKRVNMEQAKYQGKPPNLKAEALEFNAYMCNDGEHAQELARDITKGLDKTAFPVK